jgi:hypothetical protein
MVMSENIERAAGSVEALYRSGALSDDAKDALLVVPSVADKLAAGLGETSTGDELLLAVILVDDSTSVAINMTEIRVGHKLMLEALRDESFDTDVQVQTRALNRGVLSPYKSLIRAMPLTEQNYSGSRLVPETPLYLQSLLTLGTVMVKAQEEEERGVSVRTFSLIITDGEDNKSGTVGASHVRALVTDMLEFSTSHIVAGMGVGEKVDYRKIFLSMGIPEGWIFTPGTSVDKLRDKFHKIAHSLTLAASSEAAFAQLAPGPPSDR